jgi:dephospho-CoA kinase
MIRVGLTGTIASGKSEVERVLRTEAIAVFDADGFVHAIYEDGTAAKHLAKICPTAIDGRKVDRLKLSALITQDAALLAKIEAVIHPMVRQAEDHFFKHAQKAHNAIAVINSPLLIETGHHQDMDVVIVVDAPFETRLARALTRPSMTRERFTFINSKQLSSEEKRKAADYVIDNIGSLDELKSKTLSILHQMKAR